MSQKILICFLLSAALLLSACQPANVATDLPVVQPTATMLPTLPPTAIPTTVQTTLPSSGVSGDIILDLSGVAQDQTVETFAAVTASADAPYWEGAPQYRQVTLQGYPVSDHATKPQIFIYPVADLAGFNEAAGQEAADLQSQLQAQQSVDNMPFLPLLNEKQVMHSQVQYLDFKNGKGVRYVTQFDQAPYPINNFELIYTFQGLTGDGQYYIAAVLPLTNPGLPATQQVSTEQPTDLTDFPAYLTQTVTWLDQQPSSSFNPDLTKLDALIQSIEVK